MVHDVPLGASQPVQLTNVEPVAAAAARVIDVPFATVSVQSAPQAMPEPVTDRTTISHEHVFLFAKSESYFYDRWAILEPFVRRSSLVSGGSATSLLRSGDSTK